ncbi:MAG: polymer-forming cytoskeletal protein [Planctomycetota bacterium]
MAENESQTTVIGADSYFKGEMQFERTAKIIGRFDGKISGKGELQVAQSAACKADIESSVANIDGSIEGNITAKDAVKLTSNGKVKGDITATKMTMAEGASFFGMCAVGPDAAKGAPGSSGGNSGSGGPSQGGGASGGDTSGGGQQSSKK